MFWWSRCYLYAKYDALMFRWSPKSLKRWCMFAVRCNELPCNHKILRNRRNCIKNDGDRFNMSMWDCVIFYSVFAAKIMNPIISNWYVLRRYENAAKTRSTAYENLGSTSSRAVWASLLQSNGLHLRGAAFVCTVSNDFKNLWSATPSIRSWRT